MRKISSTRRIKSILKKIRHFKNNKLTTISSANKDKNRLIGLYHFNAFMTISFACTIINVKIGFGYTFFHCLFTCVSVISFLQPLIYLSAVRINEGINQDFKKKIDTFISRSYPTVVILKSFVASVQHREGFLQVMKYNWSPVVFYLNIGDNYVEKIARVCGFFCLDRIFYEDYHNTFNPEN